MTRQALPPAAQKFRTDEGTGTRVKERVSAELLRLSPCLFARQLLDAGRVREALEILEKEVASGEESAELQFWLGRAAFRLGDHVRAQSALSRAVTLSPHDAEMHRWLARVLLHGGDTAAAARLLGRGSPSSMLPKPRLELQVPSTQSIEADFDDSAGEEPPTTQWVLSAGKAGRK